MLVEIKSSHCMGGALTFLAILWRLLSLVKKTYTIFQINNLTFKLLCCQLIFGIKDKKQRPLGSVDLGRSLMQPITNPPFKVRTFLELHAGSRHVRMEDVKLAKQNFCFGMLY